jgi:hypothetical protein
LASQPYAAIVRGTAYVNDSAVNVVPEKGGQFQDRRPRMEPLEPKVADDGSAKEAKNLSLTARHARNFLDCMRTRELPRCDVEVGHRSTTYALLANIALVTRAQLEWDAQRETITNHAEANHLLHYENRASWKLD